MTNFSIIQKSQLEGAHRLDAEYYQPEYLDLEKKLNSIETKTIEEISESVVSFGAYSLTSYIEWQTSGVPYVNVGDIHDGYIDLENVKYISEKVDEILKKSRISEGCVLLTMAGTIGNAGVVHNFPKKANANQAIAKIMPLKSFSPYYLATFLNSKYGLLQTQREIVSSVQANIFLGPIKRFRVPIFDSETTEYIERAYKDFLDQLENSKSLYSQAENLLLEELGLKDFKNEEDLFSIVNISDVKSAGRMDAEYFVGNLKSAVSKLSGNSKKLSELAKRIEKKIVISSKEKYNYIEISDVDASTGTPSYNELSAEDLPANAKVSIQGGELLISKVRPTRGAVAIIPDNWKDNFIVSGAFAVYKIESPMKECLQIWMRSKLGKSQLERNTKGAMYPTVTDKDIDDVIVPILSPKIQKQIADLVRKSHEARKKSKELLEEAKRKVEEMIENGGKYE